MRSRHCPTQLCFHTTSLADVDDYSYFLHPWQSHQPLVGISKESRGIEGEVGSAVLNCDLSPTDLDLIHREFNCNGKIEWSNFLSVAMRLVCGCRHPNGESVSNAAAKKASTSGPTAGNPFAKRPAGNPANPFARASKSQKL